MTEQNKMIVIPNPRKRNARFHQRVTGAPGARFVRWGGNRGEGPCALPPPTGNSHETWFDLNLKFEIQN